MIKVSVIYHSAHGHTEHIARRIADAFAAGDLETALLFGRNFAAAVHRMACGEASGAR